MCLSGPNTSNQPIPKVATPSDPTIVAALNAERLRQSQQTGRQSTILTSDSGSLQMQTAAPKTLLGQ